MSKLQFSLCSCILKEYYGEVVERVAIHLANKSFAPLRAITAETRLKLDQVKTSLCVLIQHNLCSFEMNKRRFVEYSIDVPGVLARQLFPRYVYCAKTLYGDAAELIIEELIEHGQLPMNQVINAVVERLNEDMQGGSGQEIRAGLVYEKFVSLAQTHFIQRCPCTEAPSDGAAAQPVPKFSDGDRAMYDVQPMDVNESRKRKRSIDDGESSNANKKQKTSAQSSETDGVYWKVNCDRFNQYLRDQTIIDAISRKVDKKAGEVVRTILRLSEVRSPSDAPKTTPLSSNEIFQALPSELNFTKLTLDQWLKVLCDDASEFVSRDGDSGGGMFSVNFKKGFTALCKSHVESVVHERFGSKSQRIFRLLLLKNHLEQKQIEEMAMIPAKEAKELLYEMFSEHFVSLTEVPKTPDHAPSRTFYLFSVNINELGRNMLETCYKTMCNLMIRREHETRDNKRVLDKQQRLEAILAQLEQSGADASQKAEVEEMITPAERTQLNRVKHMTNKLEHGELQLADTIYLLQTYLLYTHTS